STLLYSACGGFASRTVKQCRAASGYPDRPEARATTAPIFFAETLLSQTSRRIESLERLILLAIRYEWQIMCDRIGGRSEIWRPSLSSNNKLGKIGWF